MLEFFANINDYPVVVAILISVLVTAYLFFRHSAIHKRINEIEKDLGEKVDTLRQDMEAKIDEVSKDVRHTHDCIHRVETALAALSGEFRARRKSLKALENKSN